MANPERGYPIIHVAGTNGKTSVTRLAARLLSGHGLTPGTFISPHLQRVEERYEYGLAPMTADDFAAAVAEIAPVADMLDGRGGDGATYFELTAALAHSWFAERSVDVAVVETGLGGRLDATNAADSEVAVVTSIGLEHTAYLGGSLGDIAAEKLAILDEGAALVTGNLPAEALEIAERVASERAGTWYRAGVDFEVADVSSVPGGWIFDLRSSFADYGGVELRLHGRHQVANFAIAVAAVEALLGRSLDQAGVRQAAATATTPGRMEILNDSPLLMIDGAHNPDAMAALGESLRIEFPATRWSLVLGVMEDKDLDGMLDRMDGLVVAVHAAAAGSGRARDAGEIADTAGRRLGVPAQAHDSVADALAGARATDEAVLVAGSLYVAGEARTALGF